MIKATINGREITLEKQLTILDAAKINGIKIPHLCHHKALEHWGGCRMCLVEVEKMPKLQTACTLYVTEGMVVRTESEAITNARRAVLEFLLINHPLDCPVCDKAGECKLQDYVMQYGPTVSRFKEEKIRHKENTTDSLIVRNPERCIMCTRCVRMCSGNQGASAIAITYRGNHSIMEPFSGKEYNCEYCGNCLTVCPVGAIMSKLHRYKYRSWQVTGNVETICSFCGVGCTLIVQTRDNVVMRTVPEIGLGTNKGLLCNRGRFGYEYVGSKERLDTPYIKIAGKLEPATWDVALAYVAKRLSEIRDLNSGKSIAGIASARCTNEDNYTFQKLIRGLQSNNIDSIARLGYAGAQRIIDGLLGSGSTANKIADIQESDAVLVPGDDPSYVNPVLGLQVRSASKKGADVITLGYAPGLDKFKTIGLMPAPDTDEFLIGFLLGAVKSSKGLSGRRQKIESMINEYKFPSIEEAEKKCNVPKEDIQRLADVLINSKSPCIIIGRDSAQRHLKLFLIAALAYIVNARLYLMSERPNEQGVIDSGCLPDMLPGGVLVSNEKERNKMSALWHFDIPAEEGLTLMEMFESAHEGKLKAMYIMGENPVYNLPDNSFVESALRKLDFLVVQDIFMTETALLADVVLPASSWAQKDGTYTNLERRIQRLKKAVKNEHAMPDWEIITKIANLLGINMPYTKVENIFIESENVNPLYGGLKYKEISGGNIMWPYKATPSETPFEIIIPLESSYEEKKIHLILEKPLFHSGTMSRKSPAMNSLYSKPVLRIHPITAGSYGLKDGETAVISTNKGSIKLEVKTDILADKGTIILSNNFEGKGILGIVGYRVSPVTKAPVMVYGSISIGKE